MRLINRTNVCHRLSHDVLSRSDEIFANVLTTCSEELQILMTSQKPQNDLTAYQLTLFVVFYVKEMYKAIFFCHFNTKYKKIVMEQSWYKRVQLEFSKILLTVQAVFDIELVLTSLRLAFLIQSNAGGPVQMDWLYTDVFSVSVLQKAGQCFQLTLLSR